MFIKAFNVNDHPKENNISQGNHIMTRATAIDVPRKIHDVNYIVENGDTLMYAVNYDNDKGFVTDITNSHILSKRNF